MAKKQPLVPANQRVTLLSAAPTTSSPSSGADKKYDVVSVLFVTPELKRARPVAARLCSGGGTCIALVDVEG